MSSAGRLQFDIGLGAYATKPSSNERGRQVNKGRLSASVSELVGRTTAIRNDRAHPATNIIRTDNDQPSALHPAHSLNRLSKIPRYQFFVEDGVASPVDKPPSNVLPIISKSDSSRQSSTTDIRSNDFRKRGRASSVGSILDSYDRSTVGESRGSSVTSFSGIVPSRGGNSSRSTYRVQHEDIGDVLHSGSVGSIVQTSIRPTRASYQKEQGRTLTPSVRSSSAPPAAQIATPTQSTRSSRKAATPDQSNLFIIVLSGLVALFTQPIAIFFHWLMGENPSPQLLKPGANARRPINSSSGCDCRCSVGPRLDSVVRVQWKQPASPMNQRHSIPV